MLAGLSTATDILTPSPAELNRKLKFHKLEAVHALVDAVSRGISPVTGRLDELLDAEARFGLVRYGSEEAGPSRSLRDGRNEQEGLENPDSLVLTWGQGDWVGTGDAEFDLALGGGLRIGTITEITGESAAGKSHLTLSLAITAQLSACTTRPGGVLLLASEREISTDRLVQLAKTTLAKSNDNRDRPNVKSLLDNVLTCQVNDVESLEHALSYKVPMMLESRSTINHSASTDQRPGDTATSATRPSSHTPIRLLIIDSLTALVRGSDTYGQNSTAGLTLRSRHLCSISDKLKALAAQFKLAIAVVNQVSDVFARPPPLPSSLANGSQKSSQLSQYYSDYPEPPMLYATQARWFSGQSDTLLKEASLGIVWANAVNVRIMMSRTGRRRLLNQEDLQPISRKKLREQMVRKQETLAVSQQSGSALALDAHDMGLMVDVDAVKPTLIRRFHVVFSPFAPPSTVDYVITPSGIHALPESYRLLQTQKKSKNRKRRSEQIDDEDVEEDEEGDGRDQVPLNATKAAQGISGDVDDGIVPGSDDLYAEVFDDLGDVPPEFWDGTWDERALDYNGVESQDRAAVRVLDAGVVVSHPEGM
ncbi:P-loop containing nucleoside triphosphate hydrolase protein [Kockovaella imperatae]|uniref:p-loop containing nucleoside triphosphate hydrolase protein n=1 Tax=Kockovaella imperatae TaxID=4999 RepID=A0A1Y1U8Z6_9TREE|nr:P-loop containing nucleoside triphosphate hydrolase protein [Kockovaella imperatae]ORX33585.1 P-loop containing nucleoside triphosphate hydrolase protein [Kockovaella imperatae]